MNTKLSMWMTYVLLHKNLKILLTLLKPNTNSKLKKLSYHLGANYSNDPGGTMVCQLRKYIEELNEKYKRIFKDSPPKDLKTFLDKTGLHGVYLMIMKILITKSNSTLMPKGATDEKLNDLSRKKVQPTYTSNRILPIVPSSGSCSPLISCYSYKLK